MGYSVKRNRKPKTGRKGWLIVLAVLLAAVVAGGTLLLALHQQQGDSSGSAGDPATSGAVTKPRKTLPQDFIDRNTSSSYVILSNVTKGEVLYSKAANEKAYPASLTKLMTAIVAVENCPVDTVLTVGEEITYIDRESSRAYLTTGSRLTLNQLLKALLLPSGNDAAYAIAAQVGRKIAGNDSLAPRSAIAQFVTKMNEKAAALGCTGTHFANPDGIHDPNHYTTAADMLRIATAALQKAEIAGVVSLAQTTETFPSGQTVTWKNSNKLVRQDNAFAYDGATGMKTGSTNEAGYCLIASAVRDGQTSIAVVMGSEVESGRWEDASGLLDISFE